MKASRNQTEMSCWKSHLPKDPEIRAEVRCLVQDLVSVLFQKSLHTELLAALHVVRYSSRKEKKYGRINAGQFLLWKKTIKAFLFDWVAESFLQFPVLVWQVWSLWACEAVG